MSVWGRQNMNRRECLKQFGTVGMAGFVLSNPAQELFAGDRTVWPNQPNILWLITEDQSVDWGCYGVSAVSTPNIDQFRSEGVLYSNAFCTSPVCSPSRSCFNTGVYQTSFGGHHHRSHRNEYPDHPHALPSPIQHVAEHFKQAGYYVFNGKENLTTSGKNDYNFSNPLPWQGTSWRGRRQGQPFFGQINIGNLDHEGGSGSVDPVSVVVPPYHPDDPLTRAVWAHYYERTQYYDKQLGYVLQRLDNDGLAGSTIVILLGDNGRQVQRGMQFLYDGGMHVPMIIRWSGVLTAGATVKELVSLVDLAPTSLALAGITPPSYMQGQIFLGPDAARPRSCVYAARDRMDETMDRIRAIRSARYKYIRNYAVQGEDTRRPYTTWGPYYSVDRKSNLYKMHSYPILSLLHDMHNKGQLNATQELFMVSEKPAEELYNILTDPHEVNNLASSPSHVAIKQTLSAELDNWMKAVGDMGATDEPVTIADQWYDNTLRPRYINQTSSRPGINVDSSAEDYVAYWRRLLRSSREDRAVVGSLDTP